MPKAEGALPLPWKAVQIGRMDTGAGGTVEFRDGVFAVQGAGEMPSEKTGDAIYFIHRPLRGDGELVARIMSVDGTAAGLMVRASLETKASMGAIFGQPREVISFRSRFTLGRGDSRDRPYIALPRWVRLKREGSEVKGYLSWDSGEHWETFLKSKVSQCSPESHDK